MLISVNQFRSWLKDSAKTLREGGATATAAVYEEIAAELAVATCDIRTACEDQIEDAEEKAGAILTIEKMLDLHEAGLMVVPIAWRER